METFSSAPSLRDHGSATYEGTLPGIVRIVSNKEKEERKRFKVTIKKEEESGATINIRRPQRSSSHSSTRGTNVAAIRDSLLQRACAPDFTKLWTGCISSRGKRSPLFCSSRSFAFFGLQPQLRVSLSKANDCCKRPQY